jgi:hypothetical protein
MTTRSQQLLTGAAQDIIDDFKSKGWGQKQILSAGVIALSQASAEQREEYLTMASGNKNAQAKIPLSDAVEALQNATVHFEMLSDADQQALNEFKAVFSEDKGVAKKKKA